MNVIALPIAGRRVSFLYRLITSGQPAPDRIEGVTGRLGAAVKTQVVEVFGQRKLLKWTVPGAAHFFVFWAFLILATVYLEAYGVAAVRQRRRAGRSRSSATGPCSASLQDFIAVMAPASASSPSSVIRLRNAPEGARPAVAVLRLAPRRAPGSRCS